MRLIRPIQTRFRYGSPTRVNLATYHNSQAHSSKGTRSLHISPKADYAPTACRHTVSGTISRPLTGALFTFPSRYLFTIGHQGVFRLRRWSSQIHTGFLGPRATWDTVRKSLEFRLRGCHPLCRRFPESSATQTISYFLPDQQLRLVGPTTPITQRLLAITRDRFGLFPFRSPLLRESLLLSLPVGTEMFHFPTLPPPALCVQAGATGHYARQVSPFGNPRIEVWLPTPRGLSQAPTSFFGSWCQGIHRVPLITWQLQMMLASTVQFSRYGRSRPSRRAGGSDPVLAEVRLPRRPFPQDPTACSVQRPPGSAFRPASGRTNRPGRKRGPNNQCSTNELPPWNIRQRYGPGHANRMNPADAPVAP